MEIIVLLIGISLLGIGAYQAYNNNFDKNQKQYLSERSKELSFLQVKLAQKLSDLDQKFDNVQSMKQNIEVMNQVYKNFFAIADNGNNAKKYGQPRISVEILVEQENIKFIFGIPEDFIENFEKVISSFYPGSVIEYIQPPKMLVKGFYGSVGNFKLAKSSALPIKTYDTFEADPMDSIISAFSRVSSDEKLSLQILLSPVIDDEKIKSLKKEGDDLKEGKKSDGILEFIQGIGTTFWEGLSGAKKEEKGKEEKKSKFSGQQIGSIDQKIEDEIFGFTMRAIAVSPISDRPEKMINDLARSMTQYNYIGLNALNFSQDSDFTKGAESFVRRFFNRKKDKSDQYLNLKEVSSLFHLPHSRYNKNPRIKWQNYKIVPAPDNLPDEGMLLGTNTFAGVKRDIKMKPVDRFRHFYVIGQTGTGKSTMLLTMAKDDLINKRGFCLIDPHGDLCEFILQHFPKERIDDLIYFDAANTDYPIGFNVFEGNTDEERDVIVNNLVEMFVQMYGHEIFGPRIQDFFRNAALALMEQPEGGTLPEIVRMFVDPAFQKIKIGNVKNPVVRTRREKTYGGMGDREKQEMIPYFQAKFGPFTTTPIIRNIIGQPKSSFNVAQAMQEGKIILTNLSKGKLGEINSQLIGRMLVTKIQVAAMGRANLDEKDRVPFFLYIDEFQNYISKSIESILSEARKYKLGLTVAHQYIDQLRESGLGGQLDLSKAIFGNIGTIMAYKVGAPDAEFLEKEFSPEISQSDLVNMDKFKAIMKLSVDTQPTRPFSITPVNPYTPAINQKEKIAIIKQISALKRGTKKELAQKEIFYRVGI